MLAAGVITAWEIGVVEPLFFVDKSAFANSAFIGAVLIAVSAALGSWLLSATFEGRRELETKIEYGLLAYSTLVFEVELLDVKTEEERQAEIAELQRKFEEDQKALLDSFPKEDGVEVTESGLLYKELAAGDGASAVDGAMITFNYTIELANGNLLDSSARAGKPAVAPLERLLPGWAEAFKTLKEGGKCKVVMKPELAFGAGGIPGQIPPGTVIVSELELVKVEMPSDDAGDAADS